MSFIVAIDGPAGTGKGTVTEILSKKLGLMNIDTGAAYRCVALYTLKNQIPIQTEKVIEILDKIDIKIDLEKNKILLNQEDVTEEIRKEEVSKIVSPISNIYEVRVKMNHLFKKLAKDKDIIMEGRDITTVVFPNADVKIYLDAKEEERAKRRQIQNEEKGIHTSYEEVLENMKKRDKLDRNKKFGSLKVAEDAMVIDSTDLSIEEVVAKMEQEIKRVKDQKQTNTITKQETNNKVSKGSKAFQGVKEYYHKEDSLWKKFQRRLVWHVLRGLYKLIYHVKLVGTENIPLDGSFILCGNHVDFIKVPIVVMFTPRKVNFIAKAELFDNPILAWLGNLFDVISVKRGKQDVDSMKRSLKVLSSGDVLGLFPEGTRNGIAKKVKVKNGAAYMALRTGKPILPVGIAQTKGLFPKIILNYGKLLGYKEENSKVPEKAALEKVTQEIMDNIIKLTNEAV